MYGTNDYRDYLEHHGIKGQKWGVENGPPYPLNAEGKKKFADRLADRKKAKKRQEALVKARKIRAKNKAEKEKEAKKIQKTSTAISPTPTKAIKKMTTAELEARIKRLQMEKQLRDLESSEKSRVTKMVEDALLDSGKRIISNVLTDAGTKMVKDAFGLSTKPDSGNEKKQNVTQTTIEKKKKGDKEITTTTVKKR